MVQVDLRRLDFEGHDVVVWFEIQLGDSADTFNVCYRMYRFLSRLSWEIV